jgi:hypothetical protein
VREPRAFRCAARVALALALAACSNDASPSAGRLVVAVTVDWEGAYLSDEGLDALADLRAQLGSTGAMTHFISAAYFTKPSPIAIAQELIVDAIRADDEVAVHLHAWKSLADASGIESRLSPSFFNGTDQLLRFEGDDDVGFDLDLDAYTVLELRALLRTSRRILQDAGLVVSRSFRAGGYLGTPKVLRALRDEGFHVDSSATDHRQLEEYGDTLLPVRVASTWNQGIEPQLVAPEGGGPILELPIAATADYATEDEIAHVLDEAAARLRRAPDRDVFVVLACHQETGAEYCARLSRAIERVRANVTDQLHFATIEEAAWRARHALEVR